MIDISVGRYWDKPWSLVDGCTPCSPGCEHCWSASMARRFNKEHRFRELNTSDGAFNGTIITHPERLSIPMLTKSGRNNKKPTVYAIWNDWCHESVTHVFRYQAVIQAEFSEQHTFLGLTKRPQVMLDFWTSGIQHVPANWWNGLTICNQPELDAKMGNFLQVPGKKFISIEPMLGPVDFKIDPWQTYLDPCSYYCDHDSDGGGHRPERSPIDAVILGGETGPGARPVHPDWVRSVRDQCAAAGVPFFFKGWGKHIPVNEGFYPSGTGDWRKQPNGSRFLDGRTHDELPWGKHA